MINSLFPISGGNIPKLKSVPHVEKGSVSVIRTHSASSTYYDAMGITSFRTSNQYWCANSKKALYILGTDYDSRIRTEHFAKVVFDPVKGCEVIFLLEEQTPLFSRIVIDPKDNLYILRATGILEKWSSNGDRLFGIDESGVLCIGANGNLFVWGNTYIREYDSELKLVNEVEYTLGGNSVYFYADKECNFYLATRTNLYKLNSLGEIMWSKSVYLNYDDYWHAIDFDSEGNAYLYVAPANDSGFALQCIDTNGDRKWVTEKLTFHTQYHKVHVDEKNRKVYYTGYATDVLWTIDMDTGLIISKQGDLGDDETQIITDSEGDVYMWHTNIEHISNYLGTVGWKENENDFEKYIVRELERGDGYMLLVEDGEGAAK